ncbi:unnamed protein product [Effrenium voratum]|nr:unnamed protein product [Effrenium voratum]
MWAWLKIEQILATLRFFDVHFHVHRSELERASIVEMLDASPTDFTKKKWNDKSLLQAFHVRMNIAERIYFTVDVGGTSNLFSRFVSGVMVFAIVVSIAVWMAGTVPSCTVVPCETCEPEPLEWMRVVDEVCVIIFTVEFLTRMLTAPFARAKLLQQRFLLNLLFDCKGRYQEAQELPQRQPSGHIRFTWISNWWSFWKQPSSVVDLFTILPYWVEVWFATSADGNFIWLRLFRLLRVSRIFKLVQLLNSDLGQLSDAQHLLANVFMQASPAFAITLALLLFALIVFSSLMYVVERASWYPASVVLQLEQRNFRTVNFQAVVHEAERAGGVFLRSLPDGYLELSPFTSIVSSCWWTLEVVDVQRKLSEMKAPRAADLRMTGRPVDAFSTKPRDARMVRTWLLPLALLAPAACYDESAALDKDDVCTDEECALRLLHMRANASRGNASDKVDYQPGRETGVSCMWAACDTNKLGKLVECHHWRCVCLTGAKWCEDGKCICEDGYVAFGGKCYGTTTTSTTTTDTWPDVVTNKPVWHPPPVHPAPAPAHAPAAPAPAPTQHSPAPAPPKSTTGGACADSPGCSKLGLQGLCCPTAGGVNLGCC